MILIADSGSTKTAWSCLTGSEIYRFKTIGLNPYFVTQEKVCEELRSNFPKDIKMSDVSKIYFYGSGCGRQDSQLLIQSALNMIFKKADIVVDSDLVGASIACCGYNSGIVAILGTGMNVGYWNGKNVEVPMPSLGYIFGDAGSGAVLGRKLIKAVFEKRFSQELIDLFQQKYNLSLSELLDKVYKQPRPNAYLASFAPFLSENRENKEIHDLLYSAFCEFSTVYAKPIAEKYGSTNISFVGSLALAFENELRIVLKQNGLSLQQIISAPLDNLEVFFGK